MLSYIKSTTPRCEEITLTTFPSKSRRDPRLTATKSLTGVFKPRRRSRFTDARAIASDLDRAPLASSAACSKEMGDQEFSQLKTRLDGLTYPSNVKSHVPRAPLFFNANTHRDIMSNKSSNGIFLGEGRSRKARDRQG